MSHYFINDESIKSKKRIIKVHINNNDFEFYTDNGVFSKDGLDYGTSLLLQNINNISGDVLDFGCGYGAIGIIIKKIFDCNVDMLDINRRSLELTTMNANKNDVSVNVFESNIYEKVNKKYDFIVSNPPIRVGKKILYDILFNAKKYLNKKGQLLIVINKNQGAKTIVKDLKNEYEVEILKKSNGFYIIRAINN